MAKRKGQTSEPPQQFIEEDGESIGPVRVDDLDNQIERIVDARTAIDVAREELNDAKEAALSVLHDNHLESYESVVNGRIYRIKRDASERLLLARVKGEPT